MLNRAVLCQAGCHPLLCRIEAGDYVTWHAACPRGACEIMVSRARKKNARASIDTRALTC